MLKLPRRRVLQGAALGAVSLALPRARKQSWRDDFNGLGNWTAKEWVYNPNYRTHPSQVSISNGILRLTAVEEAPGKYLSGTVYSNRTFDRGYFEARMKWPKGTGFDCAFWLYPEGASTPAPEIDILEAYPNDPYAWPGPNAFQSTMHYVVNGQSQFQQITHDAGHDLTNAWHTVGAYWLPGQRLEFYFDGASIGRFTSSVLPATPLNVNFSLLVGTWSAPADATTPSPAVMEVDWVRWSNTIT